MVGSPAAVQHPGDRVAQIGNEDQQDQDTLWKRWGEGVLPTYLATFPSPATKPSGSLLSERPRRESYQRA